MMPKTFESLALLFCAIYLGSTAYISLIEQPARLACPPSVALAHWTQSIRLTPRYAASALLAALAALLSAKASLTSPWTWGGLLLLSVVPFTVIALLPIQRLLTASDWNADSSSTRKKLTQWDRRHSARTLLGLCAFILFLWAALQPA
jgi:hypothetical protein